MRGTSYSSHLGRVLFLRLQINQEELSDLCITAGRHGARLHAARQRLQDAGRRRL